MPIFERILCPVDFSELSACALGYAQWIARRYESHLFVQYIVELWRHPSTATSTVASCVEYHRFLLERGDQELKDFVLSTSTGQAHLTYVIGDGSAPEEILRFAHNEHIDLIVMGTHGRRGLSRLMVGSVAERVLQTASCPMLTVHGRPSEIELSVVGPTPSGRERFLFCTDLSACSQRPLHYACSLATDFSAELTLLHVLDNVAGPGKLDELTKDATAQLRRLASSPEGCGVKDLRTGVLMGKACDQILLLTSGNQYDLVILGVREASARNLALFDTTTQRVTQLGSCPVLVVPG